MNGKTSSNIPCVSKRNQQNPTQYYKTWDGHLYEMTTILFQQNETITMWTVLAKVFKHNMVTKMTAKYIPNYYYRISTKLFCTEILYCFTFLLNWKQYQKLLHMSLNSKRLKTTVLLPYYLLKVFLKMVADIIMKTSTLRHSNRITKQYSKVYILFSISIMFLHIRFIPLADLSYCMHYHIIYIIIYERSCYAPFVVRAFPDIK